MLIFIKFKTFESQEYNLIKEVVSNLTNEEAALAGDNDPLDVVEIGEKRYNTGSIIAVKVLGCLPMIDKGNIFKLCM